MRNYFKASVRTCGFTEVFSGLPVIATNVAQTDDLSGANAQAQIDRMVQELPGSSFEGFYISPPEKFYIELDRAMLFPAIHTSVASAIALARLNPADFLLFDYSWDLPTQPVIDFITDISPRSTWSNGH
jgi:hypothetical protein